MRCAGYPASAFMQLCGVRGFWRKKSKANTVKKNSMGLGQYVYTPGTMRKKSIVNIGKEKAKANGKGKGKGKG